MLLAPQLKSYFSLAANFAVLGLKSTAKFDVVKKKYYELAKIYHPDVNRTDENAQKKFTEITKVEIITRRPISTSPITTTRRRGTSTPRTPKRGIRSRARRRELPRISSKMRRGRRPGWRKMSMKISRSMMSSLRIPRSSGNLVWGRTSTSI
jgi:hypothetical protein